MDESPSSSLDVMDQREAAGSPRHSRECGDLQLPSPSRGVKGRAPPQNLLPVYGCGSPAPLMIPENRSGNVPGHLDSPWESGEQKSFLAAGVNYLWF